MSRQATGLSVAIQKHLSAHSTNLRSVAMGRRRRAGSAFCLAEPLPNPVSPRELLLTPLPQLPQIPIRLWAGGGGALGAHIRRRPAVRYRQSCNCRLYPASGSHQRRCREFTSISCSVCMNLNLDRWAWDGQETCGI